MLTLEQSPGNLTNSNVEPRPPLVTGIGLDDAGGGGVLGSLFESLIGLLNSGSKTGKAEDAAAAAAEASASLQKYALSHRSVTAS